MSWVAILSTVALGGILCVSFFLFLIFVFGIGWRQRKHPSTQRPITSIQDDMEKEREARKSNRMISFFFIPRETMTPARKMNWGKG